MDKADPRQEATGSCAFRALSQPNRNTPSDYRATNDECACFRPLCWSDGSAAQEDKILNGKDLAAHLEEVQQLAFQRGLDGGREEACRMAQASLLPHLKSVVEVFNALIAHVKLAEAHTSSKAVSLALAIVEQVVGAPAGSYRFDELQSALSQAIALANRNEIHMNQDDLEYLRDLMDNNQLAWPNHPCVAIQGNPASRLIRNPCQDERPRRAS